VSSLPKFDADMYRLGGLCKRNHEWGSTGKSLRYLKDRTCLKCAEIHWRKQARSRDWWSESTRSKEMERNFGITLKEYENMLEQQNGRCAICDKPPTTIRLAIDHCHESGAVRGLLCANCNRGLGYFKDEISFLEAAIAYLQKRSH